MNGAHSANFNEKVHKPQSKSYGRIGAKMQHMSYEFEYFYQCIITFWGLRNSKGPYGCIKPIYFKSAV